MDYTDSQSKAIRCIDQNLQVIACAGSGKTQVISARIVDILKRKKKDGITPANIVAFTYTNKAAGELKDRIHRLCKEELGTDLGLAEMFVGTIHGYCLNLLQSPPVYKFLKYSVLPEIRQRLLIDRNSLKSGLTETPLLNGGTLKRWVDSKLYQQLIGILGEGQVDMSKVPQAVLDSVDKYYDLLEEKKFLDYTMIIAYAVAEIQENKHLREKIAGQVKYLVVDEYQDVNPLQETLIKQIQSLGANLCVVGDDDQTIYQWRGSEVENIIRFDERYPEVRQIPLNENFRSSDGIVLSARQVVERNPERLAKKMESTGAQPYQRGDVLALAFKDPQVEADWIAGKIQSLRGVRYVDKKEVEQRGLTWSDFAILLRSVSNDGAPILAALDAAGIPYIVGGMNGLFDTDEVQAMTAAFNFLVDHAPAGSTPLTAGQLKIVLLKYRLGLSPKQAKEGVAFLEGRKAQIAVNRADAELYLQRVFLDFLENISLREEAISTATGVQGAGEIVFYNLGKFSQVISDYEQVNFHSDPQSIYSGFAGFLEHQAPGYYPEGWLDQGNARPDAVQVMTVHQAKGMQWPAVFVPCLRNNRFPSRRQGGRSVWHIIPQDCVANVDRYKGTIEDERRLFYVALTRAEKYLCCSWAPIAGNAQQRKISPFFNEFTANENVLTKEPKTAPPLRLSPKGRKAEQPLLIAFSELKYYFECPYLFKLRFLYGFDSPVSRALGYGKSLHDALSEIHAESLKGNVPAFDEVPRLVDEHLHLPFANSMVKDNLRKAANKALTRYLKDHGENLKTLEHVEKVIELKLGEGIVVSGRIDLIRRTNIRETVIVDFKSDERAQAEDLTQKQLHIYAVGYRQLTGQNADLIEVHNLDKGGAKREVIDDTMLKTTLDSVTDAARKLKAGQLPRHAKWNDTCGRCDLPGICRNCP